MLRPCRRHAARRRSTDPAPLTDVIDTPDELARVLALAGLAIGTVLYQLLIRRRRKTADDHEAEEQEARHRRAAARLRRMQRRDER